MKPGDRIRIIAGPPEHPYTGWKIGRFGRISGRVSTQARSIWFVQLDGDDDPEEWWEAYLEKKGRIE